MAAVEYGRLGCWLTAAPVPAKNGFVSVWRESSVRALQSSLNLQTCVPVVVQRRGVIVVVCPLAGRLPVEEVDRQEGTDKQCYPANDTAYNRANQVGG